MCKNLICILIALVISPTGLLAQETMPATGSGTSGDQGSLSVTVGQVFYNGISATSGELSEGVQQPFEIFVITEIQNNDMFHLKVYPNPATRMVIIQADNSTSKALEYQLLDNSGRLLKAEKINGDLYIIPLQQYKRGIYYLKVTSDSMPIKSFKIVKNE